MNWIKVSDKKPPIGKDVLFYFSDGEVRVGFRGKTQNMYYDVEFWWTHEGADFYNEHKDRPLYWAYFTLPNRSSENA